jgi:hypothetical protein
MSSTPSRRRRSSSLEAEMLRDTLLRQTLRIGSVINLCTHNDLVAAIS